MAEQESTGEWLKQAIRAARERRREEARRLLLQIVEREPYNEQAWLWLSGVVDDPRDMQVALANVLTINPGNEAARKGLDLLRQRYGNLLQPEEEPPVPGVAVAPEKEKEEYVLRCYSCGAEVYDVADFCWNCHAVIHCCENCIYRRETACKERIGIRGPAASIVRNTCPDWTPERIG